MLIRRFAACVLVFAGLLFGCAQPVSNSGKVNATIRGVSYSISNTPTDWWSASSTVKPSLTYSFIVYFQGSLSQSQITDVRVYLPDGNTYWTMDTSVYSQGTNAIAGSGFRWGVNPMELPVGVLKARATFLDGSSTEFSFEMGVPGSATASGTTYVYAPEDEAVSTYPSVSKKALQRPSVSNLTTGSTQVSISFLVKGDNVNNGWVWLYDSSNNYIGKTDYFLDSGSGVCFSGLNNGVSFNKADGQTNALILLPSQVKDSNNQVVSTSAFNSIARCRIVVIDGSQYVGQGTYTNFDYLAISPLF